MKKHSIYFTPQKLKQVPKSCIIIWVLFGFLIIGLLAEIANPVYKTLDNLQAYEIHVDGADFVGKYTRYSTPQLKIVSGEEFFYLTYPSFCYEGFSHKAEEELLTGKVTSVVVKTVDDNAILCSFSKLKRIVDLRSDSAVYYDIEVEKKRSQQDYICACIVILVFLLLWLADTWFILFVCGILKIRRKKGKVQKSGCDS